MIESIPIEEVKILFTYRKKIFKIFKIIRN
jgi:hypothetical protein